MNRYCEEFECGIPQAIDDLENGPLLLTREVLDLRAFLRTKDAWDRANAPDSKADSPSGPMADRVWAAWKAIAEDAKEAHAKMLGE